MGTWDSGLWDNDSSLDELAELVVITEDATVWSTITRLVVGLWFERYDIDEFNRRMSAQPGGDLLPEPMIETLTAMKREPAKYDRGDRLPAHRKVIGGYCDGFRVDAVLAHPECRERVREVFDRCAGRLDELFAGTYNFESGITLTELGIMLELTRLGLYPEATRREAWRVGFEAMDERTSEERSFWDEYVARASKAFDLLVPPRSRASVLRAMLFPAQATDTPRDAAAYVAKVVERDLGLDRPHLRVALDDALSGNVNLAPLAHRPASEEALHEFFKAVAEALGTP